MEELTSKVIADHLHQQQNACMPAITIRNVPPETRDRLAARAAASGQSLQEYLLAHLNSLVAKPDDIELLARIRERKRRLPSHVSTERIVELIREDRGE